MLKKNLIRRAGICGLLLLAAGGCYDYEKPLAEFSQNSYTKRPKRDPKKDPLKNIRQLTLADAQRVAILNNPNYISLYHAVSAARMRYYQAIGAYSPVVSASFSMQEGLNWMRNDDPNREAASRTESFTTGTGLRATWLLFDGFARELKVKIADHTIKEQQYLEADTARTLMYSVARAYNEVLLAIENIRISKENQSYQEALLRYTRLKYQAGAVPLSDVLNFQIQMNSAEGDMVTAGFQYDTAMFALAVLMGYPEGVLPKEITFPLDYKNKYTDLPMVEVYLDQALNNRPDLKRYRELLQIAKYNLGTQYSAYSPTVNAEFSMYYNTNLNRTSGNGYRGKYYYDTPTLAVGLTADWMIFNGFIRYNQMREFQAQVAVADFNVATAWLSVIEEVRIAYANYVKSVKLTRIYEQTRNLSAEQRDLVDEAYKAGNVELTRLNEVQRDLVQAETNLASSYINIQNAKAQLDASVSAYDADFYSGKEQKNAAASKAGKKSAKAKKQPAANAGGTVSEPEPIPESAMPVKTPAPKEQLKTVNAVKASTPKAAPAVTQPAPAPKAAPAVTQPAPAPKAAPAVTQPAPAPKAAEKNDKTAGKTAAPVIPASATSR